MTLIPFFLLALTHCARKQQHASLEHESSSVHALPSPPPRGVAIALGAYDRDGQDHLKQIERNPQPRQESPNRNKPQLEAILALCVLELSLLRYRLMRSLKAGITQKFRTQGVTVAIPLLLADAVLLLGDEIERERDGEREELGGAYDPGGEREREREREELDDAIRGWRHDTGRGKRDGERFGRERGCGWRCNLFLNFSGHAFFSLKVGCV